MAKDQTPANITTTEDAGTGKPIETQNDQLNRKADEASRKIARPSKIKPA